MAIVSSGTISMGGTSGTNRSIINEKQGNTTARTNISLKGLSVDGVNDSSGGDIIGTPNSAAPYAMSEFYDYVQFACGTPGSITTNTGFPFNAQQERRNGSDTAVVTSCNMVLNTSTKTISFTFTNTNDGGGLPSNATNEGSTNTATITYTGTLTSLEAKFVSSGDALTVSGTTDHAGTVRELWSNSSFLSNNNVDNNDIDTTPGDSTSVSANTNLTSSGNFGTYNSLRTTSGNMAIALAVLCDQCSTDFDASNASVNWGGSDSMGVTLRANGTNEVSIYSRTGTFDMQVDSSVEDTS